MPMVRYVISYGKTFILAFWFVVLVEHFLRLRVGLFGLRIGC